MRQWTMDDIRHLIDLAVHGVAFAEIAAAFDITEANARKRWNIHSSEGDRRARYESAAAVQERQERQRRASLRAAFCASLRAQRIASLAAAQVREAMPPMPPDPPKLDAPPARLFHDDPAAAVPETGRLPPRMPWWNLGGSSLA